MAAPTWIDCAAAMRRNGLNVKITFVTSRNQNNGSTRIYVYKTAQFLQSINIEVTINGNINDSDVVIFQKSNPALQLPILKTAQRSKKTTAFVIDDYLDDELTLSLIAGVDLLIVSTDFLQEQYKTTNQNIIVTDTVLDLFIQDIALPEKSSYQRLGWFGNRDNIYALRAKHIDYQVTIISNLGVADKVWNYNTIDAQLQEFDLLLIPQVKTPHGMAKTCIRMLQAIYLGVPALVSDIPEYVKLAELLDYPPEMVLDDNADWNKVIAELRSGRRSFNYDFAKARAVILQNYSFECFANRYIMPMLKSFESMA
jgi:hypothetical protein